MRREIANFLKYLKGPERGLSPHTIRAYDANLCWMEEFLSYRNKDGKKIKKKKRALDSISLQNLREFLEWRKATLDSPSLKSGVSAIRATIAALKSFFRWAVNENYIEADPASALMAPKLPKTAPKTLTEAEYTLIASSCKGNLDEIELVEFMAGVGVRREEIRKITVSDVRETGKVISIHGKGNKTRRNPLVSKATFKIIRQRIERYNLGPKDPIFNLSANAVTYIIGKIVSLPELKAKGVTVTPHSLRRLYADRLLEKDVRLDVIQEVLGHASIETTRIYAKTSLRRLIAERKKIETILGG